MNFSSHFMMSLAEKVFIEETYGGYNGCTSFETTETTAVQRTAAVKLPVRKRKHIQ